MDAFCAFYRSHQAGLDGPTRTRMYAVLSNATSSELIRMARRDKDTLETGMWLGKSARGQGSVAAFGCFSTSQRPPGASLVAETTSSNVAAIVCLRRCGATFTVNGPDVHARYVCSWTEAAISISVAVCVSGRIDRTQRS
jgi:hypothetical protein